MNSTVMGTFCQLFALSTFLGYLPWIRDIMTASKSFKLQGIVTVFGGTCFKSVLDNLLYFLITGKFYGIDSTVLSISILLSPLNSLWMREPNWDIKFNIALGLAENYFHGYLSRICFHQSKVENKEMKKQENVPHFFILIPKNANVNHNLKDIDERLNYIANSPSLLKTVCEVHKRSFHFSKYEINW